MIAYGGGGALDTVIPGKTGELFNELTVESLMAVMQHFDADRYSISAICQHAEQFDTAVFNRAITEYVDRAWDNSIRKVHNGIELHRKVVFAPLVVGVLPVIVVGALVVPDLLRNPNAGGGFAVTLRYSASQVFEAIPGRDGDFQDVWLASELTVNALTDWVRTSSFIDEVSKAAASKGVTLNAGALGVAADNKRSVGQLAMSYPNGDDLTVIVAAAVEVLQTRAQAYFPQLGGREAQVTILDVPTVTVTRRR